MCQPPFHRRGRSGALARGAAAVALAGALVAIGPLPATAGPPTGDHAPTSTDPAASPVWRAGQRAIPDAALLQPADLGGASLEPAGDYWAELRPPQPCAARPYPSTALVRADRAGWTVIGYGDRPTVIMEHVATYRAGGAHRYLGDLRRALAACRGLDGDNVRWTIRATGVAGAESLLLTSTRYVDYANTYKNTWVLVARVGRALVVVADSGWEEGSGHEALVRELSGPAVRRAAVLNQR